MADTKITEEKVADAVDAPQAGVTAASDTARAAADKAAEGVAAMSDRASAKMSELRVHAADLREQASQKAYDVAAKGKDKAADLIDSLSSLTDDVAGKLKDSLGDRYPTMLNDVSTKMSGVAADLRSKNVDDVTNDVRDFVRNRPAVAIGAAAAVGFALIRLMKSASGDRSA